MNKKLQSSIMAEGKMNIRFRNIIDKFPNKLEELICQQPFTNRDLKNAPDKGNYVFYNKNDRPIYVGRTDRMKDRLKEHGQQSSTHTSATFAFNLAKDAARKKGINVNISRKDLEKDPEFKKIYTQKKAYVSKLKIRAISIPNPIEQTLFEVYVHLELKTKNLFKNH